MQEPRQWRAAHLDDRVERGGLSGARSQSAARLRSGAGADVADGRTVRTVERARERG